MISLEQILTMLTLQILGLKGNTTEELVDALANAVYDLGCSVGIDMNLKSQGVTEELLHSTMNRMAELAFEDQCTTANPKEPLISELKGIIETAYDYEKITLKCLIKSHRPSNKVTYDFIFYFQLN